MTKLLMTPRLLSALGSIGTSIIFLFIVLKENLQPSYSQNSTVNYLLYGLIAFFVIHALLMLFKKIPDRSRTSPPTRLFMMGVAVGILFHVFVNYWTELAKRERGETETVMQLDQN